MQARPQQAIKEYTINPLDFKSDEERTLFNIMIRDYIEFTQPDVILPSKSVELRRFNPDMIWPEKVRVKLSYSLVRYRVDGKCAYLVMSNEGGKVEAIVIRENRKWMVDKVDKSYLREETLNLIGKEVTRPQLRLLKHLASKNKDGFIAAGEHYVEDINNKGELYFYKIHLKHAVICYKKPNGGVGYQFYDPSKEVLGKGSYSKVYKGLGRVVVHSSGQVMSMPARHVVKQVDLRPKYDKERVVRDRNLAALTPLTHTKHPIFGRYFAFTIERQLPGEELRKLIDREEVKPQLSTYDRLLLTLEMLYALKQQVHDCGLIHRDIKPDNILVDTTTLTATIIDVNLAKRKGVKVDCEEVGAPAYMPSEAFAGSFRDERTDVYSMGVTIGDFWGADRAIYSLDQAKRYADDASFPLLFCIDGDPDKLEQKALPWSLRHKLRTCLSKMTLKDQADRLTVDEAIAQFEDIRKQYVLTYSDPSEKETLSKAYDAGLVLRKALYERLLAHKGKPVGAAEARALRMAIVDALKGGDISPMAVAVFVDVLGQTALKGVTSKEKATDVINSIYDGFDKNLSDVNKVYQEVCIYLQDDQHDSQLRREAGKIKSFCDYLLDKCNRLRLSMDDISSFSRKLKNKYDDVLFPMFAEFKSKKTATSVQNSAAPGQ